MMPLLFITNPEVQVLIVEVVGSFAKMDLHSSLFHTQTSVMGNASDVILIFLVLSSTCIQDARKFASRTHLVDLKVVDC